MKRNRPELLVDLSAEVGSSEAWGTALGAEVFARLNHRLLGAGDGTLVHIRFDGIYRSDASFQREAVVETLRKHRPKLLFVAEGLDDEDVRDNLDLALERRGTALLWYCSGGTVVIGKKLSPEHAETLERVREAGELTATRLKKAAKLSTASSRLIFLWRAGLVERREGTAVSGGREHAYLAVP